MPQARLRITIPEGTWIREISTAHPETVFRVLSVLPDDENGVALVEISADDPEAVVSEVGTHRDVLSLEVLQFADGEALVQFETTDPLLLVPVRNSRAPIELPVEIVDGEARVDLTASRDRLSALGNQLDALGMQFRVEYVRAAEGEPDVLTEAERELLLSAVERGHYDTPRGCTLTELAASFDIAKSTASERLRRAERKVVTRFVTEHYPEVAAGA